MSRSAPRQKRALAGLTGGEIAQTGDTRMSRRLAEALDVVGSDEPGELTHGFHSYPARFHPALVRRLLASEPGAKRVLDPFAGSGTLLVEAVLAGRRAFGVDINPLAVWLARLKSIPTTAAERASLGRASEGVTARAIDVVKSSRRRTADKPRLATRYDEPRFYPPHVYRELVTLRGAIDEEFAPGSPGAQIEWLRTALLLVLSSIVVKVSLQRSDTDDTIVERQIARGYATRLFGNRSVELLARLESFAKVVPPRTPNPWMQLGDARALPGIDSGSIDLVVTSPPYLGTYDYSAHHARRFGWLGLDAKAMEATEIGSRRMAAARPSAALSRWGEDVSRYVGEIARVLAPGRLAFLLVGDASIGGRTVAGDVELRRAAATSRLEVVATASQARPSVYVPVPGQLAEPRREHLLALRKT